MGRVKDLIGPRPKLPPRFPLTTMLDAVFAKRRDRKSRKFIRQAQLNPKTCPPELSVKSIGRIKIGRPSD